jgi:hypothetical protein
MDSRELLFQEKEGAEGSKDASLTVRVSVRAHSHDTSHPMPFSEVLHDEGHFDYNSGNGLFGGFESASAELGLRQIVF